MIQAAAAWLPAVIFAIGLTLALVGVIPRWAGAAWVVMGVFALITELGPVFGVPSWLQNLSLFCTSRTCPLRICRLRPYCG